MLITCDCILWARNLAPPDQPSMKVPALAEDCLATRCLKPVGADSSPAAILYSIVFADAG